MDQISFIHYFSTLSGPALAVGLIIFVCFIPYRNAMEETQYWYEFQFLVQVFSRSILAQLCCTENTLQISLTKMS